MPIDVKNLEAYSSEKILSEEKIISISHRLRSEGAKIGLCIGGYDLLHPGHMTHLALAKKEVDILIVGVTTDKFNSKRKGAGRPIYPDILRAFTLSQLKSVDYVFISKYPGAVESIELIKPHFYIKGLDYIDKNTPGILSERKAINHVGGEMKYTIIEKLSTTDIIDYIKKVII